MSSRYKVRAYCSSRSCDFVHKEDIIQGINFETCYGLAAMLNESANKPLCPQCGQTLDFYSHAVIDEPWLP